MTEAATKATHQILHRGTSVDARKGVRELKTRAGPQRGRGGRVDEMVLLQPE